MTAATRTTCPRREAGTLTLSTAIVVPGILLFLALAIAGGRITAANGAVESAAFEAARAASISRTAADGDAAARHAATVILSGPGTGCTAVQVSTDMAALDAQVGQTGEVAVTITCTAPLADLPVLREADRTITYTTTSVVDPYRSR
jgi:Flp pilus assembly protein TadG